jgi:S1-C subfamily serine protease
MPIRTSCIAAVVLLAAARLQAQSPAPAAPSDPSADAVEAARRLEEARIAVIERVVPSVVAVFPGDPSQGGGSGVIVHPDGYAVTNYHVVMVNKKVRGGLADGKLYDADVLGLDPFGDTAVFKMRGRKFQPAPMGDSDKVRLGQWALAIGNPFLLATDFKPTVTLGIVSGVHRYLPGSGMLDGNKNALTYPDCIQVDASINPGNSGGPLFNLAGEVIGINGRISLRDRGRVNIGVGFAISINQVKNFLSDMRAGKTASHANLEATVDALPDGSGCLFDAVQELGPAAKAGIEPGDKLLEFDGRRVRTPNELLNMVSVLPAGRRVRIAWLHGGKRQEAVIRLAALPLGDRPPDWKPNPGGLREETHATLEGFRAFAGTAAKDPAEKWAFAARIKWAEGVSEDDRKAFAGRVEKIASETLRTYPLLACKEPERFLRTVTLVGGDFFDGRHVDAVEAESNAGKLTWHFDYLWPTDPANRGRPDRVLVSDDPKAEWFLVAGGFDKVAGLKMPKTWKVLRDQRVLGEVEVLEATPADAGKVEWK